MAQRVTSRPPFSNLNEHLICTLCKGYLVDATTIVECLHSFCRSCIVQYLQASSFCPQCQVQLHKGSPLRSLKPDKTLQDIVYKLVPNLFYNEMQRRRLYYDSHPQYADQTTPEQRGDCLDRFYSPDDSISLSLEYKDKRSASRKSSLNSNKEKVTPPKRYLKCPAMFTVGLLKKFIRGKFDLAAEYAVEIFQRRESLADEYTLLDIAYIYPWKSSEPMRFFYRIRDPSVPDSDDEVEREMPALSAAVLAPRATRASRRASSASSLASPRASPRASPVPTSTRRPKLEPCSPKTEDRVSSPECLKDDLTVAPPADLTALPPTGTLTVPAIPVKMETTPPKPTNGPGNKSPKEKSSNGGLLTPSGNPKITITISPSRGTVKSSTTEAPAPAANLKPSSPPADNTPSFVLKAVNSPPGVRPMNIPTPTSVTKTVTSSTPKPPIPATVTTKTANGGFVTIKNPVSRAQNGPAQSSKTSSASPKGISTVPTPPKTVVNTLKGTTQGTNPATTTLGQKTPRLSNGSTVAPVILSSVNTNAPKGNPVLIAPKPVSMSAAPKQLVPKVAIPRLPAVVHKNGPVSKNIPVTAVTKNGPVTAQPKNPSVAVPAQSSAVITHSENKADINKARSTPVTVQKNSQPTAPSRSITVPASKNSSVTITSNSTSVSAPSFNTTETAQPKRSPVGANPQNTPLAAQSKNNTPRASPDTTTRNNNVPQPKSNGAADRADEEKKVETAKAILQLSMGFKRSDTPTDSIFTNKIDKIVKDLNEDLVEEELIIKSEPASPIPSPPPSPPGDLPHPTEMRVKSESDSIVKSSPESQAIPKLHGLTITPIPPVKRKAEASSNGSDEKRPKLDGSSGAKTALKRPGPQLTVTPIAKIGKIDIIAESILRQQEEKKQREEQQKRQEEKRKPQQNRLPGQHQQKTPSQPTQQCSKPRPSPSPKPASPDSPIKNKKPIPDLQRLQRPASSPTGTSVNGNLSQSDVKDHLPKKGQYSPPQSQRTPPRLIEIAQQQRKSGPPSLQRDGFGALDLSSASPRAEHGGSWTPPPSIAQTLAKRQQQRAGPRPPPSSLSSSSPSPPADSPGSSRSPDLFLEHSMLAQQQAALLQHLHLQSIIQEGCGRGSLPPELVKKVLGDWVGAKRK